MEAISQKRRNIRLDKNSSHIMRVTKEFIEAFPKDIRKQWRIKEGSYFSVNLLDDSINLSPVNTEREAENGWEKLLKIAGRVVKKNPNRFKSHIEEEEWIMKQIKRFRKEQREKHV